LQYIMELCQCGNVIPLIGNVDAWRAQLIYDLHEENVDIFYDSLIQYRKRWGSDFYDELAIGCGFNINSPEDTLLAKNRIIEYYKDEFRFLAELPTIVETQNFIFVHGGLVEKTAEENENVDFYQLTKYDDFCNKTNHVFDKYVIVGHWPVSLYNTSIQQLNPIINREKRIISIDGACGLKKGCQLNILIIPDIDASVNNISYISYDPLPVIYALEDQKESTDFIQIHWFNRKIQLLETGGEFSYVEHLESGRKLYIPNSYLINETDCTDYTDYLLPVQKGDMLSVIEKTSKGCIVKRNGVIGWYCGKYREECL